MLKTPGLSYTLRDDVHDGDSSIYPSRKYPSVKWQISVDVIVYMSRMPDGSRKIVDIAEVLSDENDELKTQSIFSYHEDGLDRETGKSTGDFESYGVCPAFLTKLAVMDIQLPKEMFM